jgi:hypothetical protein
MANLTEGAARAADCDISFCSPTCAMLSEHGVGGILPLTSSWCEPLDEIIRLKLMPNLEHVTWREPTVTPMRLAISSRLIPVATNSLTCSITCGVNLTRLPLAGGLACAVVMAAHRWRFGTANYHRFNQRTRIPIFGRGINVDQHYLTWMLI